MLTLPGNGDTVRNSTARDNSPSDLSISTSDFRGTRYIGHYYNWYAATAETGTFAQTSAGAKTKDASICPKGWQLPVDGDKNKDKSWAHLLYGSYKLPDGTTAFGASGKATETAMSMRNLPLSLTFTGVYYWVTGALNNRGDGGFYWSSTPYSAVYARYLGFYSTYVYPQSSYNKTRGFTVRCVAR